MSMRRLSISTLNVGGKTTASSVALPDVASATRILDLRANAGVTTSVTGFAGSGTIAQAVNAITGVGSKFTSEVVIGDVLTGTGINGTVTAIADDTHCTLSSSATAGAVTYTITPQAGTARVTTWADQSGFGRNFTQSGTARPTKQTVGGYPAVVFDGVDDWMLGPNFADNLASFAVFVVTRNVDSNLAFPISKISDSNVGWYLDYGGTEGNLEQSPDDYRRRWWNFPDQNTQRVYTATFLNNDATGLFHNGSDSDTGSYTNGTVTSFSNSVAVKLGVGYYTGIITFGQFDLFSAMLYSPVPNATDRAAIENWLAGQWGITF